MGRNYNRELEELPHTYERIRNLPRGAFTEANSIFCSIRNRCAYFVASGGAVALAELASLTHSVTTGQASRAITPLGLVGLAEAAALHSASVVIFSARARHQDVEIAARTARACPDTDVFLVTQLEIDDVKPRLLGAIDRAVTLPPTSPDGFLATNSVLGMSTAWAIAAGIALPDALPWLHPANSPLWPEPADRAVVLFGPTQRAAAFDLEARLSETGLADVQLADYRNIAHGRHVGLARHRERTVVVRLVSPEIKELADSTAGLLPPVPMHLKLATPLSGVAGAIDLLSASMRLVGSLARVTSSDPGRPQVTVEGRRLYHLSWGDKTSRFVPLPIAQKILEAGSAPSSAPDLVFWRANYDRFISRIAKSSIKGLVLDYDGTCVNTNTRTSPPSNAVQHEIIRLLRLGLPIGIATGRGPSVAEAFRAWLPPDLHDRITLGLYNGGWIDTLSADFTRHEGCEGSLELGARAIEEASEGRGWQIVRRPWQVTIESSDNAGPMVRAILARTPELGVRVVTSAHSVDIVPITSSKARVARALDCDPHDVMAIGDQGQDGGNDFDLLSSDGLTLSVDRVSADPWRCWNLSADGIRGPQLLVRYLRSVDTRSAGLQFIWPTRGRVEDQYRQPAAARSAGMGSGH